MQSECPGVEPTVESACHVNGAVCEYHPGVVHDCTADTWFVDAALGSDIGAGGDAGGPNN
ncbi:MAG: hypothetical protein ABI548_25525 [Polyangiaceae bacterium]